MNADNHYLVAVRIANAAERIYKVAYLLPPPENMEQLPSSFSIKLPVPTVVQNANMMINIFKSIPYCHKAYYMDKLQPRLQNLVKVWSKLPAFTSLKHLQARNYELEILRGVAKEIHQYFPTAGIPGERVTHPGFSLVKSSDPMVTSLTADLQKKILAVSTSAGIRIWRLEQISLLLIKNLGANLHQITMQFDLVISENLNRVDPRANWQITPRALFAHEPALCFIPTRMEQFQWPSHAPYGNQHQPIRAVKSIPAQLLRPLVEVPPNMSEAHPSVLDQVKNIC